MENVLSAKPTTHLVVTRKVGDVVTIGDSISIKLHEIDNGKARLGITGPADMSILRDDAKFKSKRLKTK